MTWRLTLQKLCSDCVLISSEAAYSERVRERAQLFIPQCLSHSLSFQPNCENAQNWQSNAINLVN